MTFLVVAVGAAIGACLRFLTDRQVKAWQYTQFPWGTFVVNAVGSLVLGFLTGAALFGFDAPLVHALLGTGLCGALTTFSTFSYETAHLFTDGARLLSVSNVVGTLFSGIGAGVIGMVLAAAVWTA